MRNKTKEEWERYILRHVYSQQEYPDVTHVDKPDIILEKDGIKVGIEVTRYNQSVAVAALRNDPKFIDAIYKDPENRRRKRPTELVPAVLATEEGEYAGSVIMYEFESYYDRIYKLNECISNKISKSKEYNLNEVNELELIIYDESGLFDGTDGRRIYRELMANDKAWRDISPFSTLYIVKKYAWPKDIVRLKNII